MPLKGKEAIGAAMPILMPILPASTRYLNSRPHFPLEVKIEAAFP